MNDPLRILVVSDYKNTHSVRPEAEIFMGLLKMGHEITVMTYPDAEYAQRFKDAGAKIVPYHPETKYDKKARRWIRDTIIKERIQIVHFYNSRASVNGLRAIRGLNVKVCLYRGFTGNIHWYDPTLYFKYMHPKVNRIVCNSPGVEQEFLKQPFIDKTRTRSIHKGHDTSWYEDTTPTDRKEFSLSESTLVLVNVANNRPMKGIPYLMQAMNLLPADLDLKLIIVVRDMETEENVDILNRGNNRDKVIFTGFRDDALNIVRMSDVFVLSSIRGESITKSVIEAMSLARGVIITDIPGNRQLAIHEESGLVVQMKNPTELTEAIKRLYYDRELLKRLQAGAKAHIQNHLNVKNTVVAYDKMYRELAEERS
jgi:L-malate glycosyltransferase